MKLVKKYTRFIISELALVVAKMFGFSFHKAVSQEELDKIYQLRWQVYAEEGYINHSDFPDKKLSDKYEPYSINFYASGSDGIVAAARLIKDSPYSFPTENLFNIEKVKDRNKTLEFARLVISKKYRGKERNKYKRIVMFGLAYKIFHYSNKHGYKYWVANMPEKLANSFKQFGAHFEKLSEKKPTRENIVARSIIKGYFEKKVLYPYLLDINTIDNHWIHFYD